MAGALALAADLGVVEQLLLCVDDSILNVVLVHDRLITLAFCTRTLPRGGFLRILRLLRELPGEITVRITIVGVGTVRILVGGVGVLAVSQRLGQRL